MSGTLVLIISIFVLLLAYYVYGSFLDRSFGTDPERKVPAYNKRDGIDYIPAKTPVLFGHHFASIAGAGPIVGPVLGICFGWGPALLWILAGSVFIGAVHDYAALYVSVRKDGLSIGTIVEDAIGRKGKVIFLIFSLACLLLVVAIFAILVAKTFVASPEVATSSLLFIILAPLFGLVTKNSKISLLKATLIFLPFIFLIIYAGTVLPLDLVSIFSISAKTASNCWMIVLFCYVFLASVLPVWILLQPRDYLNSYLLYAMLLAAFAGVIISLPKFALPAFRGWSVATPTGADWHIFPILFVIVACGACSGFHSLVASGTSSKQISSEKHIRAIGYGGMLLEALLAVMALICVGTLSLNAYNETIVQNGPVNTFASTLAVLLNSFRIDAGIAKVFISLTISAFMLTTLDTATRLSRFTLQELVFSCCARKDGDRKIFFNRYFITLLVVLFSAYLAISGEASKIWPVFGASNQLLAAVTLLVIAVINKQQQKKWLFLFIPFVFMILITLWALFNIIITYFQAANYLIFSAASLLIITSLYLVYLSFKVLFSTKNLQN